MDKYNYYNPTTHFTEPQINAFYSLRNIINKIIKYLDTRESPIYINPRLRNEILDRLPLNNECCLTFIRKTTKTLLHFVREHMDYDKVFLFHEENDENCFSILIDNLPLGLYSLQNYPVFRINLIYNENNSVFVVLSIYPSEGFEGLLTLSNTTSQNFLSKFDQVF